MSETKKGMTLVEMKYEACKRLPELTDAELDFYPCSYHSLIHWPTEGLQVCHEVEKLVNGSAWQEYMSQLSVICMGYGRAYHATYEQRLEALCRVWWPERFE